MYVDYINRYIPMWGLQRNNIAYPFSMWLGDHVDGDLVELKLRPVYRR